MVPFNKLPTTQQEKFKDVLPNQWRHGKHNWKINNRATFSGGVRGYYWCGIAGCQGSCIITVDNDGCNQTMKEKVPHSCIPEISVDITDFVEEERTMVKLLALERPSAPALSIALEVDAYFKTKYAGSLCVSTLSLQTMENLVRKTRYVEHPDWKQLIISAPFRFCREGDTRSFFRFNCTILIDNEPCEIVGFAHPDILFELGGTKLHGFVDCTFKMVPTTFGQVMIIMMYFSRYDLYVPVYYILLPNKRRETYAFALAAVTKDSNSNFDLVSYVVDYEQPIILAMSDEFPNAAHIGCNFHWKQANRRKLLSLNIPEDTITRLIGTDGIINFLCILPYDLIPKGIQYIRKKMDEGHLKSKFDEFWCYFNKNWMKKTRHFQDKTGLYLFTSWNISHLIDSKGKLLKDEEGMDVAVNRTNNPLERFNRKMNEDIPIHPSMSVFVEGIKRISNEYVDVMNATRMQKGRKQVHAPVNLPRIPADFASFRTLD